VIPAIRAIRADAVIPAIRAIRADAVIPAIPAIPATAVAAVGAVGWFVAEVRIARPSQSVPRFAARR
jgi:hypothetical protein